MALTIQETARVQLSARIGSGGSQTGPDGLAVVRAVLAPLFGEGVDKERPAPAGRVQARVLEAGREGLSSVTALDVVPVGDQGDFDLVADRTRGIAGELARGYPTATSTGARGVWPPPHPLPPVFCSRLLGSRDGIARLWAASALFAVSGRSAERPLLGPSRSSSPGYV